MQTISGKREERVCKVVHSIALKFVRGANFLPVGEKNGYIKEVMVCISGERKGFLKESHWGKTSGHLTPDTKLTSRIIKGLDMRHKNIRS